MTKDEIPKIYVDIVGRFLAEKLSAKDFALEFQQAYKREKLFFDDQASAAFGDLFYAAEAYYEDPSLRDEGDLDEDQLAAAAREFDHFVQERRLGR